MATLLIGLGTPAWAACTAVSGAGVTNTGTVSGYCVTSNLGAGPTDIINNGTISTSGISFSAAGAMTGSIQDTGTIVGGITLQSGSQLTNELTAISIAGANSTFSGNISNAGQIQVTASGIGISVNGLSRVNGNIVNSGTIEAAGSRKDGIKVYGVTTVDGNFTNAGGGTISAVGAGVEFDNTSSLTGGITNAGTIVSSATAALAVENADVVNSAGVGPGITNSGLISTGRGPAIIVVGIGQFIGGITNSGTVNGVSTGIGIYFSDTFSGGIVNASSGTITASVHSAIAMNTISTFTGGIINNGHISAGGRGIKLGTSTTSVSGAVRSFAGGITNTGTISAALTGIEVANVLTFVSGISNSGTISSAGQHGIYVGSDNNLDHISTFAGGIKNTGLIVSHDSGIQVGDKSVLGHTYDFGEFSGGVTNSGTISAASHGGIDIQHLARFLGGVSNSGTISAGGSATGIFVTDVSTFSGGIANTGSIFGSVDGIAVSGVADFNDGISNGGRITGGSSGILVRAVSTFSGGISNSGTMSGASNGIQVQAVSSFGGGITNSGLISTAGQGILVTTISDFSGGISNSGLITAAGSALPNGIHVTDVTQFAGGIGNSGTILANNIGIEADHVSTFLGGIRNSGSITGGIAVSTITQLGTSSAGGGITNSGHISGGVTTAVYVAIVHTFYGNIVNSSSGTLDGAPNGIAVTDVSTFAASIINAGSITSSTGNGIFVGQTFSAAGSVQTFLGGISNSGTISVALSGIYVNSVSTFAGGVTNSGSITAAYGLDAYQNSAFSGGVSNSGIIVAADTGIYVGLNTNFSGGVTNSGSISAASDGIFVGTNSTFAGGISNAGTISAGSTGIYLSQISTFAGGITNSGAIQATDAGIRVRKLSDFSGGISNSGLITAGEDGVLVAGDTAGGTVVVSTFSGGISNSGTISAGESGIVVGGRVVGTSSSAATSTVQLFQGGVRNSGTISAASGHGIFVGAIVVDSSNSATFMLSTFTGGISNSGTIAATAGNGIFVGGTATSTGNAVSLTIQSFQNGITNSGTISAAQNGIFVGGSASASFGPASLLIETFQGGISNSGSISAGQNGIFVGGSASGNATTGTLTISTFAGGITNSGHITAVQAGIRVGGSTSVFGSGGAATLAVTFGGNISNSGTISAATGIRVDSFVSFAGGAIINTGTITGTTAAIDVSAAAGPMTIDQTSGLISGAIKLSSHADVLTVSGGAIDGDIVGAGSTDTLNFALGSGSFDYGAAYRFTGIQQVNVNTGSVFLEGANQATNVTVNGGLLEIGDASHTSATLTNTTAVAVVGGTLAGHGTITGAVNVGAAGTIMPGGSIGVLTIGGDLTMQSVNSTYAVDFTPTQSSRSQVNGNAVLGGSKVVATLTPIPGYGTYVGRQYTILSSGQPLVDRFNPNVTLRHAPLTPSQAVAFNGIGNLTYDAHNVFLALPSYNVTLALAASPPANVVVATDAFNQFIGAGGVVPAEFQSLSSLSGSALNHAIGQLAGQTQGSFAPVGFIAGDLFINLLLNPYIQGRDGFGSVEPSDLPLMAYAPTGAAAPAASAFSALHVMPQATFQPHIGFWAAGYGAGGSISGNATTDAASVTSQIYGIASGADYRLTPDTMVGLAVGGGTTSWQLGQGAGSGHSDMFQTGLYGSSRSGPAYVSAALAYSLHDISTNRVVAIGGSNPLHGSFDANILSARVEAGYRLPYAGFAASPYGAIRTQAMFLPSYGEYATGGAAVFGMNYTSRTFTTTRTEVGAWFDSDALMNKGIKLYSRLAYVHDFHDEGTTTAFFQSLPNSSSIVINSVKPARDGGLITLGAEYQLGQGWSVLGRFDSEFSRTTDIFAGTGMIKKVW